MTKTVFEGTRERPATGKRQGFMSTDQPPTPNLTPAGQSLVEPSAAVPPPHDGANPATLLAGYRGGALLVRADATVIAGNEKAAAVEALLQHQAVPEIATLIAAAAATGASTGGTVSLSGGRGDVFMDVDVLPQAGTDALLLLCRDVTMERNLRTALVESRQRYKDLVEISSDFAWEVGPEAEFVFVSPRGALGYSADDLVGHAPADYVIDADKYDPVPFYGKEPLDGAEIWMRRADNTLACVEISCLPLYAKDGKWRGARGVCKDVTQERDREAALNRARYREQLLNFIVGAIRDEVEPEKMLTAAAAAASRAMSAAGCRIYRQSKDGEFVVAAEYGDAENAAMMDGLLERLGSEGTVIEVEAGAWQVMVVDTHYNQPLNGAIAMWKAGRDGGWNDDDVILLGDVANHVGIAIEQVVHHEHIVKLSRTDGLTGLLNRRAFYEEDLPRRIRQMERDGGLGALFYLDMDNFKRVNDVHGHQRGDEAILYLRTMLLKHSRASDAVSRLGGDEFALWLGGVTEKVAVERARSLLEASQELRQFSGDEAYPLGLSIGVAIYDAAANDSLDDFVARADEAMYAVKKAGKGGIEIAKPPAPPASEARPEARPEAMSDGDG